MKLFLIGLLATANFVLCSSGFAQSNQEWFDKVPGHLKYGSYLGKINAFKNCSIVVAPSDKDGIIINIKKTKLFDVLGSDDKSLASIHVLPSDTLTGSSKYPAGPFESKEVLSFGYSDSAFIIEKISSKRTVVTIEEQVNGKLISHSCTVKQ